MLVYSNALSRFRKSTNGRVNALIGPVLLIVAGLPSAADERVTTGDPMTVCPHQSEWANEVVPERGSDARRLRRLHAKLLEMEAPSGGLEFTFRLVSLARETGVQAYFVAMDAPASEAVRGLHLAAGIGHNGRIVVFDGERASKPDHGRLRLIEDRTATAIFLGEAAVTSLAGGDTGLALEQFELALELDPEMAWTWSGLGEALRRQGERERAMDAYENALRLAAIRTW